MALVLSGLGHGLLLALGSLPVPVLEAARHEPETFELVDLPPEVRVPPPPPPVRRPEPPLVTVRAPDPGRLAAAERVLAPAALPLPPPPRVAPHRGFAARVGSRDVPPLLQDGPLTARLRARYYPEDLRRAGVGGRVDIELFVESTGAVDRVTVVATSGYPRLDQAAVQIGRHMHFLPALSRDRKVGVWVAQTICFVVIHRPPRRGESPSCPPAAGGS